MQALALFHKAAYGIRECVVSQSVSVKALDENKSVKPHKPSPQRAYRVNAKLHEAFLIVIFSLQMIITNIDTN